MNSFDVVGADSLVNGLKQNKILRGLGVATAIGGSLGGPPPKYVDRFIEQYEDMKYYLSLNRCGRILLEKGDTIPLGLWPSIFGKLINDGTIFKYYDMDNSIVGGDDDDDDEDDDDENDKNSNASLRYSSYVTEVVHDAIFCLLKGQVFLLAR